MIFKEETIKMLGNLKGSIRYMATGTVIVTIMVMYRWTYNLIGRTVTVRIGFQTLIMSVLISLIIVTVLTLISSITKIVIVTIMRLWERRRMSEEALTDNE